VAKLKVLLIRPENKTVYGLFKEIREDRIHPPLGLLYLDAYLTSLGYQCSVWDERISQGSTSLNTVLQALKPDVVGMGGTTPEVSFVLDRMADVKAYRKGIITVAGGIHFSAVSYETYPNVDCVITGEAEQGFALLLDCIAKGLPYKRVIESSWVKNLDSLPAPRWENIHPWGYHDFFGTPNLEKIGMVVTSRGCPYRCLFCYNSKNPRPVRFRSVENVEAEIKKLVSLGIRRIVFCDDSFSLDKKRTLAMCNMIARHNVTWLCLMRADKVEYDIIDRMVSSGCANLSIGIESGDENLLARANKKETIGQIKRAFDILIKFDMLEKRASFIFGHPYETMQTAQASIELALSLPIDRAFFNIMTPYPSSVVYDMAINGEGIHMVNKDWKGFRRYGNAVIRTDELSPEDLIKLQREAHRRFYTQPRILLKHMKGLINGSDQELYCRPLLEALEWSAHDN